MQMLTKLVTAVSLVIAGPLFAVATPPQPAIAGSSTSGYGVQWGECATLTGSALFQVTCKNYPWDEYVQYYSIIVCSNGVSTVGNITGPVRRNYDSLSYGPWSTAYCPSGWRIVDTDYDVHREF
jgi:hypothetical protein